MKTSYDRNRHELNVVIHWPFYANLRLGRTQNALWIGHASTLGRRGPVFNRFPLRRGN